MVSVRPFLAATMLALLAGCTFADSTLWPTLAGEDPRGRVAIQPAPTTALVNAKPPQAMPTDLPFEMQRLQNNLRQRSAALRLIRDGFADGDRNLEGAVAQLRRTPGADPGRAGQASRLEAQLAQGGEAMSRLAALSSLASSDAALALYLVQASRAAAAQPGVDTAEKTRLAGIQRDAANAAAEADRLVADIGSTMAERGTLLAEQRRTVTAAIGAPAGGAPGTASAARTDERRPLVTIRFERPDTPYDADLRYAIGQALQRRPDASFDIVAVAPAGTPPAASSAAAKRNMTGVVNTMTGIGVTPDRLTLSATTRPDVRSDEVRVFVR